MDSCIALLVENPETETPCISLMPYPEPNSPVGIVNRNMNCRILSVMDRIQLELQEDLQYIKLHPGEIDNDHMANRIMKCDRYPYPFLNEIWKSNRLG